MKEFHLFKEDISEIERPKAFTFPFYYTPHPLCEIAAKEVYRQLELIDISEHNFGTEYKECSKPAIGKMIGILIVKNEKEELGYLCAYSGNLQSSKILMNWVPAIEVPTSSTKENKLHVDKLNKKIKVEREKSIVPALLEQLKSQKSFYDEEITKAKNSYKISKKERELERQNILSQSKIDQERILIELAKESSYQKSKIKELKKLKSHKIDKINMAIIEEQALITKLEKQRKEILVNEQRTFEDNLIFTNINKEKLSLHEIFQRYHNKNPNVGTGECCAPKLLNFAFKNKLTPIAMAEFWWGAPHKKNIRRHKNYYPACTSRCGPLLKHLLKGLIIDEDPIKINWGKNKEITTLFEDDFLLIINKPEGLLTTPGKYIKDSVQTRLEKTYSQLDYIMPVHRLDQGTSGIVIIAKSISIHGALQKQFISKKIKKVYTAILTGVVEQQVGIIDLPLAPDPNNPPFQLVSKTSGKKSQTKYKVLKQNDHSTLIQFEPLTGRTHQLRVHSAHQDGLNMPIKGDDMYGLKEKRMYLHASEIQFIHPQSKEEIRVKSPSSFKLEALNTF